VKKIEPERLRFVLTKAETSLEKALLSLPDQPEG
jgi:hypothetical protein